MNSFISPILACDSYKLGHQSMYPKGMSLLYSNFTPRSNRLAPGVGSSKPERLVFYGLQGFMKWFLIEAFNKNFFEKDKNEVIAKYDKRTTAFLGEGAINSQHISDLHDLGYLPIEIKALPEGSLVDMKTPVLTIKNTHPNFAWLVNYLETAISSELWKSCTTATTAFEYKQLLTRFAQETGSPLDFVLWQGHDFSLRGLSGLADAASSSGHLTSFLGSDTVPAADYVDAYYSGESTFVAGSVPASEHSVASANILNTEGATLLEKETKFFQKYVSELFPTGVVSYVSDTFSFWDVITKVAVDSKDHILSRKPNALGLAKTVFRPDSGNPVDILCGTAFDVSMSDTDSINNLIESNHLRHSKTPVVIRDGGKFYKVAWNHFDRYSPFLFEEVQPTPEMKGAVECLWDIFGGTTTETGHRILNERVGLIYGDSITLDRAYNILQKLKTKRFASANVVFGIGSYTYQHVTRDSYGFAMKATYCEVDGVPLELYKDPKTDDGTKKSAKGLLRVEKVDGRFYTYDQQSASQEKDGVLGVVFRNSSLTKETTFEEIRAAVASFL